MTSDLSSYTPLISEAIEEVPLTDIHVHLAGTISPSTAWELGVRNKFITVFKNENGKFDWKNGPNSLPIQDPFEHYSDIFKNNEKEEINLDNQGNPINLEYNIDHHSFKSFDRIMATIQGHRHPPGGIQNENDIIFVLDKYLKDCIKQKVLYTEIQLNIKMAYQLYSDLNAEEARKKLYILLEHSISRFDKKGITLRFIHCFNKTQAAGSDTTTHDRAIEASIWLREAEKIVPGVFVGIESAGHEKDESGWPIHLKAGYEEIQRLGLGCEAHGGEGIGVEHMLDVVRTLPVTRLAHGFQVIEDEDAISEVKKKDITLIMMPLINLKLGACVHGVKDKDNNIIPKAKSKGGEKCYITELHNHPFYELLRKYELKIALGSDNPCMGGYPIKEAIKILAGLSKDFPLPTGFRPLSLEELMACCENSISSAFCSDQIKNKYKKLLSDWYSKYK